MRKPFTYNDLEKIFTAPGSRTIVDFYFSFATRQEAIEAMEYNMRSLNGEPLEALSDLTNGVRGTTDQEYEWIKLKILSKYKKLKESLK